MPKKLSKQDFIIRSLKIHGDLYDYTHVILISSKIKVKIYCKKHNIMFSQIPSGHLCGKTGCKKCTNDKKEKTFIQRYNIKNPFQSKEIKEKIKQTNLKKYGVENPGQSPAIKEKIKQTNLKKYGTECTLQSKEIMEKTQKTNLKKYGTECTLQSKEIMEKTQKTLMQNYNVDHPFKSLIIRERAKLTIIKRYNVNNAKRIHIPTITLNLLNNTQYLIEQHHNKQLTLTQIAENLKVYTSTVINYFNKNGIEIKRFQRSAGQRQVEEFIQSVGYKIISNTQNILPGKHEIDIFVPEKNKAIEYNGLFWHKNKGRNYHLWKTNKSSQKLIPLYHVWEDMWLKHQFQTKDNIIKFLLNIPQIELTEQIEIDLATDNPQIYLDLGYKIQDQLPPQLYSEDVWDCGSMKLYKS